MNKHINSAKNTKRRVRSRASPTHLRQKLAKDFRRRLEKLDPEILEYSEGLAEESLNVVNDVFSIFVSRQIDSGDYLSGEDERIKIFNWSLGNPSVVIDMNQQAAEIAQLKGQRVLAKGFQKDQENALDIVTEKELIDRFSDYQLAMTDILSSNDAIKNVLENAKNEEFDNKGRFTSFFERIKDMIKSAFSRLKFYLIGIRDDISEKINEVISSIKEGVTDVGEAIIKKLSTVFNSIRSLFSSAFVKMLEWAATIRTISTQKGFALKSVKVSIEPAGVKTITFLGFPLPTIELKLPKIDFEFG